MLGRSCPMPSEGARTAPLNFGGVRASFSGKVSEKVQPMATETVSDIPFGRSDCGYTFWRIYLLVAALAGDSGCKTAAAGGAAHDGSVFGGLADHLVEMVVKECREWPEGSAGKEEGVVRLLGGGLIWRGKA